MGLFSSTSTCDWCSTEFEGDAIVADGLKFCSPGCLALKNAPPIPRAEARARATRELTRAVAESELAIASTELDLYERLAGEADRHDDDDEGDFMRAQESYMGLWRNLVTVRDYLATRGADLQAFDDEHRFWLATEDSFRMVSGRRRNDTGIAIFQPENANRARRAIAALRSALATRG